MTDRARHPSGQKRTSRKTGPFFPTYLGPAHASPGGWGAEESELAPSRTLRHCLFPNHHDLGTAEFGQYYESVNERVIVAARGRVGTPTPPCETNLLRR